MPTLDGDITATQGYLPQQLDPGFYTIDDEYLRVLADMAVERDPGRQYSETRVLGSAVIRGIAGSTAAAHSSGATLTPYYPDAPGGEGGGEGDHLHALVDVLNEGFTVDGNTIEGEADGDEAGAILTLTHLARLEGGASDGLGDSGRVQLSGATGDAGGAVFLGGGGGGGTANAGGVAIMGGDAPGGQGGEVGIAAGEGADGFGASLQLSGGGVGLAGDADLSPGAGGNLFLRNLPTVDPDVPDAIWLDHGALRPSGGASLPSGTEFPDDPVAGDLFRRTDLGMEFYRDGTLWLSTQLNQLQFTPDSAMPFSVESYGRAQVPVWADDIYLVASQTWFYVDGGSALDASHKWVGTAVKQPGSTTVVTVSIDSGASGAHRVSEVTAIDALLGDFMGFEITWAKTGTPGSLFVTTVISYRYVAAAA